MKEALHYASENRTVFLEELKAFLAIPSISTKPDHKVDVERAAEWLAEKMRLAGLDSVQVVRTEGHPLVYADWLHAGPDAPTVLIYGHYDVQPAEPLDLWQSAPFDPQVRDNYLYARGASDDKGQTYIHLKAVEAYLKTIARLPVNVKFIVEGEEESGGASLAAFIPNNQEMLAADVVLISDTAMLDHQQPAIVYGLRGNLYTFLDISGPDHDLHSGSYGGGIDNPLNALCHIVAKLKDEEGRIMIPGFYDNVSLMSEEEQRILNEVPFDENGWLKGTGAPQLWGESRFTLRERLGARPTLDVNGIIGGYTGEGRKTVLPSKAHAKISMRLVPNQDPQEIAELFKAFVREITPPSVRSEVTICSANAPSISELNSPAINAASLAYAQVFGRDPVFIREGGSIPVVAQFQQYLGLEAVMMGFGLPDDRIHSPNERFYLPNFYRGIETSIYFMTYYAEVYGASF